MIKSILLLSTISLAGVVAQQCPGDTTGCWMCTGSPLMQCLNAASNATNDCLTESTQDQPLCLCAAYTWAADCWAVGLNCREWRPNAVAAVEMCSFASSLSQNNSISDSSNITSVVAASATSTSITSTSFISNDETPPSVTLASSADFPTSILSSLVALQSQITSSIWHDDSGTDIPTLATMSDVIPTATHLQNEFASAMSALPTSASSGAPYAGPSVVVNNQSSIVTQTGTAGDQITGQAQSITASVSRPTSASNAVKLGVSITGLTLGVMIVLMK